LTLTLEVGLLQKYNAAHNLITETPLIWSQNSSIRGTKTFTIISTTGHNRPPLSQFNVPVIHNKLDTHLSILSFNIIPDTLQNHYRRLNKIKIAGK
jgi:hypothetical protein